MSQIEHTPPRWKRGSTGETARDAAKAATPIAPTIRTMTFEAIKAAPSTGEQVLARLRAAGVVTVLYSVKPRLSELARQGLIVDSGRRGVSDSGKCKSIVWRQATAEELSLFLARKAVAQEKGEANG